MLLLNIMNLHSLTFKLINTISLIAPHQAIRWKKSIHHTLRTEADKVGNDYDVMDRRIAN